jgi:hypothetical protein
MARILRSSTLQWKAFQELTPIGGVVQTPAGAAAGAAPTAGAAGAAAWSSATKGPAGRAYLLNMAHCGKFAYA